MPGGLDPVAIALLVPIGGMGAIAAYEWWDGQPRASVLSSVFFCFAFSAMFVAIHGTTVLGLSKLARSIAVGLEIIFIIGVIYFLRKRQSNEGTTKSTA